MIKGDYLILFFVVVCLIWMIYYIKYIIGLFFDFDRVEGFIYIKFGCKICFRIFVLFLYGI